jgi:hypothetical protein
MLPAVRYDYYKTRLNRDVRSDASRELLDLTVERVGSLSRAADRDDPPRVPAALGWSRRSCRAGNPSSSPRRGLTELDRPLDWTK